MLKAIRLTAYQNMVNYRKPTSIAIQDSFKLPPYSTVIGMIHNACGFTDYHPMKIAVSGIHATSISDLYTRYYLMNQLELGRHQLYVNTSEAEGLGGRVDDLTEKDETKGKIGITRSLGHYELLIDVELVIHVVPENEKDYDTIFNGFIKPEKFPSLGRHEDLLRIDEVSMVNITQNEDADPDEDQHIKVDYDTLIPMEIYNRYSMNFTGSVYLMNKIFTTKNPDGITLPFRQITDRVKAKIVKAGSLLPPNVPYDRANNKTVGVFLI